MGKASSRKRAARIAAAGDFAPDLAAMLKALGVPAYDADTAPHAAALIESARGAIANAVPASVEHDGRRYWIRLSIAIAHLEIFDDAASAEPVARAICGGSERYGHSPCH